MKNLNFKRKLRVVLMAAIYGAVLFDVMGFISMSIRSHTEAGYFWNDFSGIIGFILFLPTILILSTFGLQNVAENVNGYIVYALSGAFIFSILAAIWQFVMKSRSKNQTAGIE
jgi:hypothetical protein